MIENLSFIFSAFIEGYIRAIADRRLSSSLQLPFSPMSTSFLSLLSALSPPLIAQLRWLAFQPR